MLSPDYRLTQMLVAEEIERVVTDAVRDRQLLRSGQLAHRLRNTYPNSGMSGEELVNQVIAAAAKEGVPVEMSRIPTLSGGQPAVQPGSRLAAKSWRRSS